jgi:hypothetical protein
MELENWYSLDTELRHSGVDRKAGTCRKRKSSGSSAMMALTSARSKKVNYFSKIFLLLKEQSHEIGSDLA